MFAAYLAAWDTAISGREQTQRGTQTVRSSTRTGRTLWTVCAPSADPSPAAAIRLPVLLEPELDLGDELGELVNVRARRGEDWTGGEHLTDIRRALAPGELDRDPRDQHGADEPRFAVVVAQLVLAKHRDIL
ncbi:hypothetical protein NGB36_26440 [Streptomyces sp. RB6PN25]|uniref:Uncharacterized protein n=1 Tax=Streptomyces humicola TaxID=2953240 RepID=A0ABT1Q3V0_9ACTN|nr:hypothetical protein [Streptomyces humicola]MCQ4084025.1 hypothetical protein [Streptomyces humicola]